MFLQQIYRVILPVCGGLTKELYIIKCRNPIDAAKVHDIVVWAAGFDNILPLNFPDAFKGNVSIEPHLLLGATLGLIKLLNHPESTPETIKHILLLCKDTRDRSAIFPKNTKEIADAIKKGKIVKTFNYGKCID